MNLKGHIQLLLSVLLLSALIACSEGHANREPQRNIIRFTNSDGTIPVSDSIVLDNFTGLMWLRDSNCIRTNYPYVDNHKTARDGLVTYKDALDFVSGLNKGQYPECSSGYNDWRLPTKEELRSILNSAASGNNIWVNRHTIANIRIGRYWFSFDENKDTIVGRSLSIWYYNNVYPYLKGEGCYVWPVRSENSKSTEALKADNKKQ